MTLGLCFSETAEDQPVARKLGVGYRAPMADVHIEHIYNCSEDTFWDKLFFDQEYNNRLYKEALEFPEFEVAKFEDGESEVRRSINVVPKLGPMPGPIKKLIGDGLGYTEDGVFNKSTRRYTITITPNKLSGKVSVTGTLWTEPAGDGKCNRIFEAKVVAKVFGVGGMLEKQITGDMETSYAKGAEFTNEYLKEKGL